MVVLGALVNGIAAVLGGLGGMLVGTRLRKDLGDFLLLGMALCICLTGIQGMFSGGSVLLVTLAMTLGGAIGHIVDIDGAVRRLGDAIQARAESLFAGNPAFANISRGFVSSTLVICIGSMAIVGSLESGLVLDHSTLYAKSLMDFIINVIMATTMGAGVMLSGIVVFAYEALLSLGAAAIAPVLTDAIITQMLTTGSLLLFGLGLNMLGVTDIKVANFLPACLLPIVLTPLQAMAGLL
ncbi:MAG: DUF554 domain-containing protein [Atopobiaceae bacterium]|nr:DUF554 domain-containing protein [Atopobiaceae bacterium]